MWHLDNHQDTQHYQSTCVNHCIIEVCCCTFVNFMICEAGVCASGQARTCKHTEIHNVAAKGVHGYYPLGRQHGRIDC